MKPRALLSQLKLDGTLTVRHRFLHVVLLMAALFGGLVRFALPEQLSHPSLVWIHDAARPAANEELHLVASEADLRAKLVEDKDAVGLSLNEGRGVKLLLRGSESDEARALARTEAEIAWLKLRGVGLEEAHATTTLRAPSPPVPFSLSTLPMLLAVDVIFMGFLFASVMLLQEKQLGTVRFFRVGPSSAPLYVGSKALVNLGLSLLGTLVMFGVAMPRGLLEPWLWAFVAAGSLAMTFLGMGLSAFFRNLSGFFYPLMVVGMASSLPMAAYLMPTLELGPLEVLPTWSVMVGVREALFPTGASGVVSSSFAVLSVVTTLAAAFAFVAVRRRVLEVRP